MRKISLLFQMDTILLPLRVTIEQPSAFLRMGYAHVKEHTEGTHF